MSDHSLRTLVHRAAAMVAGHGSSDTTRRDIARGLTGLTLGGVLATRQGIADVAGKTRKKNKKKRCKGDTRKCGKKCIPKGDCCNSGDCAQGELCAQGACVVGQGSCEVGDDVCIDLANTCGGGQCVCFTSMSGATRCAPFPQSLSDCNTCTSDSDCAAFFPDVPGAFCIRDTGPNCQCGGSCYGPCTALD